MSDCALGLVQDSEDPRYCWVATDIQRCSDLVDGSQWISALEQHLKAAEPKSEPGLGPGSGPGSGGSGRQLRMTVSEGDAPQFWASAHTLRARNDALRKMQPPARKVRLLTQHEVLFWFNVGPGVQKRDRVYVTDSKCPHQGVCLLAGELKDVEDIVNEEKVPMVRCPRHNKTFDLRTGESLGNCERLRVFPCKFHQGRYYVRVPVAETSGTLQAGLRQQGYSQHVVRRQPLLQWQFRISGSSSACELAQTQTDRQNRHTETHTHTTPTRLQAHTHAQTYRHRRRDGDGYGDRGRQRPTPTPTRKCTRIYTHMHTRTRTQTHRNIEAYTHKNTESVTAQRHTDRRTDARTPRHPDTHTQPQPHSPLTDEPMVACLHPCSSSCPACASPDLSSFSVRLSRTSPA